MNHRRTPHQVSEPSARVVVGGDDGREKGWMIGSNRSDRVREARPLRGSWQEEAS
ncbi:hypothetical protein [Streptomyces sp. MJP52]|uniref:hypothetical protein n=1 Tax=Streptomyces sp. MJP52 TaxID=2940555 RepID=UPI0024772440|nr:hypothetical protein [Streptomyces sp. MJP52]MDH6226164.1 hypothetical protein [Streptomyces sp. MJP52]